MSKKPVTGSTPKPGDLGITGMTLRDYFAAKALMIFLANDETNWDEDTRDAYAVADKMLKAREAQND